MFSLVFLLPFLASPLLTSATPSPSHPSSRNFRRAAFTVQNGKDAIALNAKFASLTPNSTCKTGEEACVNKAFAQCVDDKFVLSPCGAGLECVVLPLVLSPGTSVTCDTAGMSLCFVLP